MSKFSFRTKALDNSKALPIYLASEEPDILNETANINRAVPIMPTGMEKEEEEEEHIKKIIEQQQMKGTLSSTLVVPTTEIRESDLNLYDELYPQGYKLPRSYLRQQLFGFAEEEPPNYDLDTEDEAWLESHNAATPHRKLTELELEAFMAKLEEYHPLSDKRLQELIGQGDHEFGRQLYSYYKEKLAREGTTTIMPHVKSAETTDIHAQHDPYVAFRRRVEKMQTRKDRQNQETQYINMLKLQRDFEKVRSLMIMVKKREETKKDVLRSDAEITKLRHELKDWDGTVMKKFMPWLQPPRPIVVPPPAPDRITLKLKLSHPTEDGQKKRRKPGDRSKKAARTAPPPPPPVASEPESEDSATSAATEDGEEREDPFRFRRRNQVYYHAPLGQPAFRARASGQYHLCGRPKSTPPNSKPPPMFRGFCRRRMGRGGRIIIDRLHSQFDQHNDLSFLTAEQAKDAADQTLPQQLLDCRPSWAEASRPAASQAQASSSAHAPGKASAGGGGGGSSSSSKKSSSKKSSSSTKSRTHRSGSGTVRFPVAGNNFGQGGEDVAAGPRVKVETAASRPEWMTVASAAAVLNKR